MCGIHGSQTGSGLDMNQTACLYGLPVSITAMEQTIYSNEQWHGNCGAFDEFDEEEDQSLASLVHVCASF